MTVETMRALVNECIGLANVQRQPEDIARNRMVYERVVKEMRELGNESTWQQCRTEIKKLNPGIQKVSD